MGVIHVSSFLKGLGRGREYACVRGIVIIGCRRGDRGIDVLHVYNGKMPVCYFVWFLVSDVGTGAFRCFSGDFVLICTIFWECCRILFKLRSSLLSI